MDEYLPRFVNIDGHFLTVPILDDALAAMRAWEESKTEEVAAVLAPFGLHPYDLAQPEWLRRLTYKDLDELESNVQMLRRDKEEAESD